MFELKPDYQQVLKRFEAWWECEIVDRPLVGIRLPRPEAECIASPQSQHATHRDRWLDTEFVAAEWNARMHNTVWLADALPVAWPNLGPEIFSAYYGCEMEYGETTAWSEPILGDWSETSVAKLQLDLDNFYFRKTVELTDALLELGKDKYIVGYTDLHGGADAVAAFRDPEALLFDTIERPEAIKALCDRITDDFLRVFDLFYDKLHAAGMPATTWIPAVCSGRMHVASNDFSCMISDAVFEDLFIPSILRECAHMERCIYHLDGPQALRYLDRLCDIPDLHAIQWVPGAGNNDWENSIEVYQHIQRRKMPMYVIDVPVGDLPLLFESLDPHGVWISSVSGVEDEAHARAVVEQISGWTVKR